MSDPFRSYLDSHSSDSEEESVEHRDNLGNQLGDLLGHQTILDGASSPEKEPFSTDLANLGRALFLEDKEKRLKRLYGARQGKSTTIIFAPALKLTCFPLKSDP